MSGLFTRDDFARMALRLAKLKGRFILSINDRPEVRKIFKAFEMEEVEVRYTVGGTKPETAKFGELIITGGR